MFITSFGTPAF